MKQEEFGGHKAVPIHFTMTEPSDDDATKENIIGIKEQSAIGKLDTFVQPLHLQPIVGDLSSCLYRKDTTQEISTSTSHVQVPNGESSLFLHVPSCSQDSSNTCCNDVSMQPHICPYNSINNLYDSSNIQHDTSNLKPYISSNGESLVKVFANPAMFTRQATRNSCG